MRLIRVTGKFLSDPLLSALICAHWSPGHEVKDFAGKLDWLFFFPFPFSPWFPFFCWSRLPFGCSVKVKCVDLFNVGEELLHISDVGLHGVFTRSRR